MNSPLDSEPTTKELNTSMRGKDLRRRWWKFRLALRRKNLVDYDLTGAILSGNWAGWDLTRSVLRGAMIVDANFPDAVLTDVDMRGSMSDGVNYHGVVAPGAKMHSAMFHRCNMAGLNGVGVKSTGVHLDGTNTDGMLISTMRRKRGERVRPGDFDVVFGGRKELTAS